MRLKERLRELLERHGVVLPQRLEDLPATLKEYPDWREEILWWASDTFQRPFIDLLILNPPDLPLTDYGKRLWDAKNLIKEGGSNDESANG